MKQEQQNFSILKKQKIQNPEKTFKKNNYFERYYHKHFHFFSNIIRPLLFYL